MSLSVIMEGLVLLKEKIQDLLDNYKTLFYKVELYNIETSWKIDFKMDEVKQVLEDIDELINSMNWIQTDYDTLVKCYNRYFEKYVKSDQ